MSTGKRQTEQGQPPKGKRRSSLSQHEDLSMRFTNARGVVLFHIEFIRSQAKPRATFSAYDSRGEMTQSLALNNLDA